MKSHHLSSSTPLGVVLDVFLQQYRLLAIPDGRGHRQRSEATVYYYSLNLQRTAPLHAIPVGELTPGGVLAWHDELAASETPAKAHKAHACLRHALSWARRRDLVRENPAGALGLTLRHEPGRPLAAWEVEALRETVAEVKRQRLERTTDPWLSTLALSVLVAIELLEETGARLNEICRCTVAEVRLRDRCILRRRTKTGTRAIPLAPRALARVEEQLARVHGRHLYLIPSPVRPGEPVSGSGVQEAFRAICKRAGIQGAHPHDLRHTFAFTALASGMKLEALSIALGHTSIETTRTVYGRHNLITPEALEVAVSVERARETLGRIDEVLARVDALGKKGVFHGAA